MILAVRTPVQVILFKHELRGQLSDGFWENSRPREHYRPWCKAEVVVDPTNLGRDFYALRDRYNFASPMLYKYVGDRMLSLARIIDPLITDRGVRRELRDLSSIIKIRRE